MGIDTVIPALLGLPGRVKTLLDRLTSTRAGYLDNLDAAISTRAAASSALSTATWTSTKAGYLDAAVTSRMGSIKTLSYDSIDVTLSGNSSASNTKTITSVDTSKTVVFFGGFTGQLNSNVPMSGAVKLTNSTTVTAYGYAGISGAYTGTITVYYVLVEFN